MNNEVEQLSARQRNFAAAGEDGSLYERKIARPPIASRRSVLRPLSPRMRLRAQRRCLGKYRGSGRVRRKKK
jgi:hypothetical protein